MIKFFASYSGAKKVLHKLRPSESEAVKDNHFLRAFFARVIDDPEFQKVTKHFDKTTEEILDLVHTGYSAFNTKELLDGEDADVGVKKTTCILHRTDNTTKHLFNKSKNNGVPKAQFRSE